MGEQAYFFAEDLDDPQLAQKLARIKPPPSNPELLARLINRHAGNEVAMRLLGVTQGLAEERNRVRRHLARLKSVAAQIASVRTENRDVDQWMLALDDLLPDHLSAARKTRLSNRVIDAIDLLATLPLAPPRRPGRSPADENTLRVVRAIAAYCDEVPDMSFRGEPRFTRTEATTTKKASFGPATHFTAAVLEAVGAKVTDSQLITYMRAVREERDAGKSRSGGAD